MAEGSFTYFNKNNGDVNTFPRQHARLEALQNWVTVTDEAHLAELQATYEGRPARGGLLGSPGVGDRVQPDPDPAPEIVPDPVVVEPEIVPDPEPDPVVEPDPEPITPLDPADRPARSAVRAEWVKWAVKSGASVADAESMTKSDLIEVYGE